MFITSSYSLADMPKAKTEQSDFTISRAKILLAQQWENNHINMMDLESAFVHDTRHPENKGASTGWSHENDNYHIITAERDGFII